MHRCQDAKRHGLLRFELFKKIDKFLSLNFRNFLISPFEGEKKFLSELRGLRNFREGFNLKYSCRNSNSDRRRYFLRNINYNSDMLHHDKNNKGRLGILAQHEAGLEPSPEFLSSPQLTKKFNPLTKREGCDSVITDNLINMNHSLFLDTVFSRFTSHFSLNRKAAFTLAEVLITLGIIGIVAALTLPVIISDVKNSQLEAGLKKAYSVLGQALNMYQAENGERIIAGDATNRRMIKSYLMQYIKSAKDCGFGGSDNKEGLEKACLPNNYKGIDGDFNGSAKYETYNGKSSIALDYFDDGQFVTPDGMLILIENSGGQWFGDQVFISVDVNGYNKKPNRLGQDLFMFQIDKNGALLPMGAKDTKYYSINDDYCSNTSTHNMNGAGCTNSALMNKNFFKKLPR